MHTDTDYAGLTAREVAQRVSAGHTNAVRDPSSRSAAQILRANVFTVFNALLAAAVLVVLLVGSWRDAVFGLVLVINTATGTLAEIKAKRKLDSLAVLATPLAHVVRDGTEQDVPVADVVLDELLQLRSGDQVPADGFVLQSTGLEIDEAILTGESVTVTKQVGDRVMSGTTVMAGTALVQIDAVGAQAYAHRLAAEARKFTKVHSELQAATNRVLTWIGYVIVPMTLILLWSQLRLSDAASWQAALVLAVAGVVGMVPQGLVLLTSVNFAGASLALARKQVLVQELPAVEVLARVDMLCLDKTGTITSGGVQLEEIRPTAGLSAPAEATARAALAALVSTGDANATATAVASALADVPALAASHTVPFSSARKWAALVAADSPHRAYVFGAPEIVLATTDNQAAEDGAAAAALRDVAQLSRQGSRVLVVASAGDAAPLQDAAPQLPTDLRPELLVVLSEEVRDDAAQTLSYFRDQGVAVKVISGDNPVTVAAIAAKVGLRDAAGRAPVGVDARTLPPADEAEGQALADALAQATVLGRVTPEQKRDFVRALQARGHTVAMTGDGVNDALALKNADLGIAMGNGAAATKAVARLVLLDGRFSSLPRVVAEGRRVMANMERVAALFLAKTTYAALLAVAVAVAGVAYPFLPRQLTIVGVLTIGMPAFILALAPARRRYRPGFLRRVLRLAVPAGLLIGTSVLAAYFWLSSRGVAEKELTTGTTLVLIGGGLILLAQTARPWVWWRVLLVAAMAAVALLCVLIPAWRAFFLLTWPSGATWLLCAACWLVLAGTLEVLRRRA
ncbi:HAD family hydrolase [Buchananella hordeovulneris]|uniref:HAD-IC family P-type ATPase n=1 Tax=Buchananella hordeovulneris TaxID=52770 RepID=UPI000F5EFDBB|nr:HAD-IC family P-type ATPase [Buchananella hordeovulneris]RRD53858.1 HAD family hydrolase [Buchananella hordeovulneris]